MTAVQLKCMIGQFVFPTLVSVGSLVFKYVKEKLHAVCWRETPKLMNDFVFVCSFRREAICL